MIMTDSMIQMPVHLTYVSDAVICCRLRGIYSAIKAEKYAKAVNLINDTLFVTENAEENDLDHEVHNKVITLFYKTLIELAMKRYSSAHNNIRELYYIISSKYF